MMDDSSIKQCVYMCSCYVQWPARDMQLFSVLLSSPLHCGENVSIAVETFTPRWKHFLRGETCDEHLENIEKLHVPYGAT